MFFFYISVRCSSIYSGWIPTLKISSGPVDVKDLLNEGSLGMFGDRYSHLMHELQVNLWSLQRRFVKFSACFSAGSLNVDGDKR